MANYASTKIFFEGSDSQLKQIEKLLIKPGVYSQYAIDFSYMNGKVPGISDKQMYQLFGCDWDKYIRKEYSTKDINVFRKKVAQLIDSEKWIGLRDSYVNESSQDVVAEYEDNKLVIKATFSWYCPTLFFTKVAQDFGLTVKVLEFLEGNETYISYVEKDGQTVDLKNNFDTIRENENFRNLAIELGLHTPSELVVSCLISGDEKIVTQLIQKYDIDTEQISSAFYDMLKYAKEGWDVYGSSVFIGLNKKTMLQTKENELIDKFSDLQNKVNKEVATKKSVQISHFNK